MTKLFKVNSKIIELKFRFLASIFKLKLEKFLEIQVDTYFDNEEFAFLDFFFKSNMKYMITTLVNFLISGHRFKSGT